eukprot:UN32194
MENLTLFSVYNIEKTRIIDKIKKKTKLSTLRLST